jgi:deoxyribodipyrimidine photo-lyase
MSKKPAIVWFRRDLRMGDNPALMAAVQSERPLICLYIDETDVSRREGGAKQVWLHHSLKSLEKDLKACGASLVLRQGEAQKILNDIIDQTEAEAVFWNRRYEEHGIETDKTIKSDLKDRGLKVETFNGSLLTEPWEISPKSGGDYYKVFTPYWRAACQVIGPRVSNEPPLEAPDKIQGYNGNLGSDDLSLLPKKLDWDGKIMADWTVGEKAAWDKFESFMDNSVSDYADERNIPSNKSGTSRLSPHLAAGEISPRQIWAAARDSDKNVDVFLSEIGWREFSYVLLFHNPKLASENYKPDFNNFDWVKDDESLEAWQRGQTGYPFVDAGLRELYQTGWMHNRVRMVVASFLVKHLLIDWRKGEDWFWDCLLEADPASNAASWQWVAGSGADAAPYFRIFNPFSQGEKFDKEGDYVREFVPELKKLPKKYIHTPWKAPQNILDNAGVKLGKTYPKPIVDHKFARERALSEYKSSRGD